LNRAGFFRRPFSLREWTYDREEAKKKLLAWGACAVRMVAEYEREHVSQWTTIVSIVSKISCSDLHQSHPSADN
jgi:hypothetical protein